MIMANTLSNAPYMLGTFLSSQRLFSVQPLDVDSLRPILQMRLREVESVAQAHTATEKVAELGSEPRSI